MYVLSEYIKVLRTAAELQWSRRSVNSGTCAIQNVYLIRVDKTNKNSNRIGLVKMVPQEWFMNSRKKTAAKRKTAAESKTAS